MRYALLIDEDNWRAEAIASGLKSHLEATEIIVVSTPVQAMTYIDDHEQLPSVIVAKATFNRSTTIINLLNELQSYIDTAAIPVVLYMQQPQQLPTEIRPFYHITEVFDECSGWRSRHTGEWVTFRIAAEHMWKKLQGPTMSSSSKQPTTERLQAIVLRRTNYGEADRILQLMTNQGGRAVMARGVRREKSRLAGGVELLSVSDVVLHKGRGKLAVLTSARLQVFFEHILADYERLQLAYDMLARMARVAEYASSGEWYTVLHQALEELDDPANDARLAEAWFLLHLSELAGHQINLATDETGSVLRQDAQYRYDPYQQSLVLQPHGTIGADHIKLLRLMRDQPLPVLKQVGGVSALLDECLAVARHHMES